MDLTEFNRTTYSTMTIKPTLIWCLIMPLIHLFSLISNILCIIVFCSNIFFKKPIAIYFICLLISDSITLLIGYIEMIDRESHMINKSSLLCIFNAKIIHTITNSVYTFMERFCLEWMLYKVLWTRVSTLILAILSIQRSRTFFSLSYHESRLCAFFACMFSIVFAIFITCIEWIGVYYDQIPDSTVFSDMLHIVNEKNSSRDFYLNYLNRNSNETKNHYSCLMTSFNSHSTMNQSNCSTDSLASEFYNLTKTLLSTTDQTQEILMTLPYSKNSLPNNSLLITTIEVIKPSDIMVLFDKRSCSIKIDYFLWLKLYDFLNSVKFTLNRRVIAIFFGNALPSFIVVLANLLSIKVIYFSKSLKYLKESARKNHRKRRLQSDLRAFLVILIESFSIIMISWGIPILLTMYHCRVLYVTVISNCLKIKDYLALFLFTDLFNSSTNCLLYSLSGKLFRRKFISILQTILTCGRGTVWSVRQHSVTLKNSPLEQQLSNNAKQTSRGGSFRYTERLSSPLMTQNIKSNSSPRTTMTFDQQKPIANEKQLDDSVSLSLAKTSDDQTGGCTSINSMEIDKNKTRKTHQSIRSYLINKVRSCSTTNQNSKINIHSNPTNILPINKKKVKSKRKLWTRFLANGQTTNDISFSTSSRTGSISYGSQRKNYSMSKVVLNQNHIDNSSLTDKNLHETLTSL